jgi:TPR repeat protein
MRMGPFRAVSVIVVLLASVAMVVGGTRDSLQSTPPSATDSDAALGLFLGEEAAAGDPHAQAVLGNFFALAGHFSDAAKLYRQAADQGDASAEGSLGELYRQGEGVTQDFLEAYKWSRAAADQGDPLGEFTVAGLNLLGQGRPVDHREAAKWARLAAEQDCAKRSRIPAVCARAQAVLGAAYLLGIGVPQNYVLAHMWATLAAAALQDDQKIAKVRDDAASKMTPEQISDAQRLAREWKPNTAK